MMTCFYAKGGALSGGSSSGGPRAFSSRDSWKNSEEHGLGMLEERGELIQNRVNKALALAEKGGNPFVNRFEPTHKTQDIHDAKDTLVDTDTVVTVAGRALVLRSFGKANFFHLQDGYGKIQIYVKKGMIADADLELYQSSVDAGDILGVRGKIFVTKTGELTIGAENLWLLSKAYRPLPEKWAGLKDVETRYRQRYLDLIVNWDVREVFQKRSAIISWIRRELDQRGYMEVETPMMQPVYGGATARPFVTHHNTLDMDLYLRIAPELYLKRLLVGGFEKVYEINRNFRNEGISTRHNPEFTMLELYTSWWDYTDTMGLLEDLIRGAAMGVLGGGKVEYQGSTIDLEAPFARRRMLDLVHEALKLPASLQLCWGPKGQDAAEALVQTAPEAFRKDVLQKCESSDEILVAFFEEYAEKGLIQPTIVYDFPKSLCPLAKRKEDDPHTAERFEFFVAGLEMANAYSELNDPDEQAANFHDQLRRKEKGDEEAGMMDEDYVMALEQGMPPASGLGIGIDRLVMLLTNAPSIRDVILFPLMRPE
jgi:lysyl-tRNA synthetase class 2